MKGVRKEEMHGEDHPPKDMDREESESLSAEELREDHETAEKALERYEAAGIEGTIPYSEYRAKRLGSEA